MSKLILVGFGLAAFILIAAFFLARISHSGIPHTLINGRLQDCPDTPNCVSSEDNGIDPIHFDAQQAPFVWKKMQLIITEQGGQILMANPEYLWASFATPFFGFTDDVEARIDFKENIIHLRSASRIGHYDFGTNKRRLQKIKEKMNAYYLNREKLKNIHE